jgi:hypothetical protein
MRILSREAADAHEKIDDIVYQNPEVVADMDAIENIIGRFVDPQPGAPPWS